MTRNCEQLNNCTERFKHYFLNTTLYVVYYVYTNNTIIQHPKPKSEPDQTLTVTQLKELIGLQIPLELLITRIN